MPLTDKTFTASFTWDELQALREADDLRQQNAALRVEYQNLKDDRDFFKNRVEELLTEQLHLLEVPVKYEQKFTRLESILGIDADTDEDVINEVAALKASNAAQAAELKAALKRIEELEAPPVVVPDVEVTPAPAPVFPFAGAYFEDPRPDDSVDTPRQAKEHADALRPILTRARAETDLTDFITFCNLEDLKYGELPLLMERLNVVRWWQSPVQTYFIPGQPDQSRFIEHLQRLKDAGVYGVFVDDANNISANDMPRLIDLINRHIPGAPVACSFPALFDASAYPSARYIDSRQWFTRQQESEAVWFPKWDDLNDAAIYTVDVWRRGNGYMHSPARVQEAVNIALPLVKGIAWYSICNRNWNHITEHDTAKQKDSGVLTMWEVIIKGTAKYLEAQR